MAGSDKHLWPREVRRLVLERGLSPLTVNRLNERDLDHLDWTGEPLVVEAVADALARVARGEVDYLAVRDPWHRVVATGGVDYALVPSAPTLWQLATHPALRGVGIGTMLITSLEQHIIARGYRHARLRVETLNHGAQRLYRRLGYAGTGCESGGWLRDDPRGGIYWYETELLIMTKPLP